MRAWLGIALISEAESDDRFLADVLRRSAQERCGSAAEVADPVFLRTAAGPGGREALADRLIAEEGSYNLVVVHRDGATDWVRQCESYVDPLRQAFQGRGGREPVVPVREIEAWALADGDALRTVLGVSWPDDRLGLPERRQVESVPDPKRRLKQVVGQLTAWKVDHLTRLGEHLSLDRLRELPSFRRWESDFTAALACVPGFTKR